MCTIYNVKSVIYSSFPCRFVIDATKVSILERLLCLLLVRERVGAGTQDALSAKFATISWWI